MSIEREHHLESSWQSDAQPTGKVAGKRNVTDTMSGQDASGGSVRELTSSPAPDAPDAFDFSYVRPLAATDQAVEGEVQRHVDAGERDVNSITNAVFYRVHPELDGKKLEAGDAEAKTWIWLRDTFVAPAVKAAPAIMATPEPAQSQAAPTPAAPTPAPTPANTTGGGDVYRTQNDNLYMAGGTCNMTSLTMALLSFADGDEMRVKRGAGDALKKLGKPLGGIKISGKREDLRAALDTPDLLEQIQVEDLLTTLAGLKGLKVTHGGTILTIAKATGLVESGKAGVTATLNNAKGRARAAELLGKGDQVILGVQGGPGHYVFLKEVREDGVVVHDPAGCRCQYEAPFFLPTAQAEGWRLKSMMSLLGTPGWIDAARRRLSHNAAMLAIVEKLIAAKKQSGKEQAATIKELATGEMLAMGETNFYGLADITKYQMDIRVEMHGA